MYLADLNSGKKLVRTVEYTGPRQSADFVHSGPGSGELARTGSVSFYNARVNGTAAFASFTSRAVDLMEGGDVLARPSYYNEAWVSTGASCHSAPGCTGWRELDRAGTNLMAIRGPSRSQRDC